MQTKALEHSPAPQAERAVYGFFLLISASVAFIVYALVSYMPELAGEHFAYLPDKYWSIALPAYLVLVVLAVVPLYLAVNMTTCVSEPLAATAITDRYALSEASELSVRQRGGGGIAPAYDIPLTDICQFLYE